MFLDSFPFFFRQLCANAPSYLQLPNLLPKLFLSYLEHTPCSKFIYNEFLSLIFTKFSISEDLQTDFPKWAKKVISSSNKVAKPVSMVHPSQEFNAPTPLGIVDLLPKKAKSSATKSDIAMAAAPTPLSLDSLRFFLYDPFPTQLFGEVGTYLIPAIPVSNTPVDPIQELGNWTVMDFSSLEDPANFILNMHLHLAQPMHCIILSRPVFFREAKCAFRQIGIMHLMPEHSTTMSISWVAGKNDVGTLMVPSSTSTYSFQTSMEPDTQQICVVSPCPSVQFDLFNAHPYYLPRWLDGFYCQLDLSSPVLGPYLEVVATCDEPIAQKNDSLQPKEPAGSKTGRVVKALQTDTVIAKEPLKGSRRSQASTKNPKCDVEGMICKEAPTWMRLGAGRPTRCTAHKVPDMVKSAKEVVPLATKPASQPLHVQKAKKVVVFEKAVQEVDNPDFLSAPGTPEVQDVSQQSIGDLFGKPSASPTKQHICREESCRKKATYTIDTEDDDTVAVFCADHAKHIPGVYLAKGPL